MILLPLALSVAVPLKIEYIRSWSPALIRYRAKKLAPLLGERGADVLFPGLRGRSQEAFTLLVEGIACLAYQPGGVTFMGQRWEVR